MFIDVLPAIGIGFGKKALLTYRAPMALPQGALVVVPFRSKKIPALVAGSNRNKTYSFRIRAVERIVTNVPLLPQSHWKMLWWLAEATATPPGQVARLFIPSWLAKEKNPLLPAVPQETVRNQNAKEIFVFGNSQGLRRSIEKTTYAKKQMLLLAPTNNAAQNLAQDLANLNVKSYFGGTRTQDKEIWHHARDGFPCVVAGTRAALFLPFRNLGLIGITDETNPLYFQEIVKSKFHISFAARFLAKETKAELFFGGLVPSMNLWHRAKRRISVALPQRATNIVSLRTRKRTALLAEETVSAITKSLARKGKILIFAARRGEAPVILCRDCNAALVCPRCEAPLPAFRAENSKRLPRRQAGLPRRQAGEIRT